ncbi:unnamed protein product, partial [Hapterophycus canaliculatus]
VCEEDLRCHNDKTNDTIPFTSCVRDLMENVPQVQASGKREGLATVPGVSWSNVDALACVR